MSCYIDFVAILLHGDGACHYAFAGSANDSLILSLRRCPRKYIAFDCAILNFMEMKVTYQDVKLSTRTRFMLSVALLYKTVSGYSAREVNALFRRYGVYDFLEEFKDIEMMLSEEELLRDVNQTILANGGHFHADLFAKRKSRFHGGVPTVSTYDVDIEALKKSYEIKIFEAASEEWFDYIVQNRIETTIKDPFDLIIGNIADENVRDLVNMYVANPALYVKSELIKQLKPERFPRQIVFKTERVLGELTFVESYLVR